MLTLTPVQAVSQRPLMTCAMLRHHSTQLSSTAETSTSTDIQSTVSQWDIPDSCTNLVNSSSYVALYFNAFYLCRNQHVNRHTVNCQSTTPNRADYIDQMAAEHAELRNIPHSSCTNLANSSSCVASYFNAFYLCQKIFFHL